MLKMDLEIKTYATLRKYGPPDMSLGDSFKIHIEGNKIIDVINYLKIPPEEHLIIMVNGMRISDLQQKVNNNDLIVFFPQLGGG